MLAALYDVHGNLAALEAVLDDARARGAQRYLLGGDYALFGARPAETVAALRALGASAQWIRGNGERWTADPAGAPDDEVVQGAIAACAGELGAEAVAELAALPESLDLGSTAFWHGSPISDVRSFGPDPAGEDAELLACSRARRVVFGHTHVPFARRAGDGCDDVELVNPGSVGMPFDGDPRASYALVDVDLGGEVEHRRVAYDHAGVAREVRSRSDRGWAEVVARRLEQAAFVS